jgi:hypothetical protein
VVIACHGGIVGTSVTMWLGLPAFGRFVDLQIDNASLTEWVVGVAGSPRLVRFNDAAHLAVDFGRFGMATPG